MATVDPKKVGTAAPTANTPKATPLAPDFGTVLQQKIGAMYDAQQQARLNQWYAERDKGIGDLNRQIGDVGTQYADLRSQADVNANQNMRALNEKMASQGLATSGENITGMISQNNARMKALGDLSTAEGKAKDDLGRQIADLNDPSKVQKIYDDIAAQRSSAQYDAFIKADEVNARNKETEYQHGRDTVMDKRYADETAYSHNRDKISDTRYTQETAYAHGRDKIADARYKDETAYNRKITEREWNQMSPAEKQRMALQYQYSKKLGSGGGGGGGGSSKKSTSTKKTASSQVNYSKGSKGEARPTTAQQYISKEMRLGDPVNAYKISMAQTNAKRKAAGLKPIKVDPKMKGYEW